MNSSKHYGIVSHLNQAGSELDKLLYIQGYTTTKPGGEESGWQL